MGYKTSSDFMLYSIYAMGISASLFIFRVYIESDILMFLGTTMGITSCILFIISWVFEGSEELKKPIIKNKKDHISFPEDDFTIENEVSKIEEEVKRNHAEINSIKKDIKNYANEQIQKRERFTKS